MANILVIDDSLSMRQLVSQVLQAEGHSVTTASDGEKGLASAGQTRFELIITDLNMPCMDGLSLVKCLRGMANYQHTPIITLTTESSAEKRKEALASGVSGWLAKPFEPARLSAMVEKVLKPW